MLARLLVASLTLLLAQGPTTALTGLLSQSEPLTRADLDALREAAAGLLENKTFFTYGGFGGGTMTVGAGPRMKAAYYGDRATEWTGLPARSCDGERLEGELVVEWESTRAGWGAAPRASTEPRIFDDMFKLWDLPASSIQDAGFQEFDGLEVRGLRYPYDPPTGSQFDASWQTLWFEPRTGLPVRYEIEVEAPEQIDYGYFLAHALGWQGGPDAAMPRPDCVPTTR